MSDIKNYLHDQNNAFNSDSLSEEQLFQRIRELMKIKAYSLDGGYPQWNPYSPEEVLKNRIDRKYIQNLTYGGSKKNPKRVHGGRVSKGKNKWIKFVKKYAKENGLTYKDAMIEAKKHYRKK